MADLNEAFSNYKAPSTTPSTTPQSSKSIPYFRKSWPQYNNTNVDETVNALKKEHPTFNIHKVPKDTIVTMDIRTDRIRVYYDTTTNLVSSTPTTG